MMCTRRGLIALALGLFASASVAESQIFYDRTSFLNGFGTDSTIWTGLYRDLSGVRPPTYLGNYAELGEIHNPDVNRKLSYGGQTAQISSFFTSGSHVLVAHSLGSLVARGVYLDYPGVRPNISGIVATVAPHQGTPMAANAERLSAFMADVQRRVNDAVASIRMAASITPFLYFTGGAAWVAFGHWMLAGWSFITAAASVVFWIGASEGEYVNFDQLRDMTRAPARIDLIPNSPALQSLNRFDDGSIPRANIYGTIPIKNAAIRLQQSLIDKDHEFDAAVKRRDAGVSGFKKCKYAGYATIVLARTGRRCSYARKVLQRLDDRWTRYVNGADASGRPRMVPFDGVVPNDHSVYPTTNGLAYDKRVDGVNHLNVYKTRRGLDEVVEGMRRMNMRMKATAPPPDPSSPPPPDCVQKDGLVCPQ